MGFYSNLQAYSEKVDSLLCVGLDPHGQDIQEKSGELVYQFCKNIIDSTYDLVTAYKPNIAFFEALGMEGHEALQKIISYIPDYIPVILDGRRVDNLIRIGGDNRPVFK